METKKQYRDDIHERNFKHNFTRKKVGQDFLLHNLPKRLLEQIDLETLKIESNELLPSRYRTGRDASIIYSVQCKDSRTIYALLYLADQDQHEEHMALRVWEYQVGIGRAHLQSGHKRIPLILAFVFYCGQETWKSRQSIAELFDDFDLYVDLALKEPFLINLSKNSLTSSKNKVQLSATNDYER